MKSKNHTEHDFFRFLAFFMNAPLKLLFLTLAFTADFSQGDTSVSKLASECEPEKHWFCVLKKPYKQPIPESADCCGDAEGPAGALNCQMEIAKGGSIGGFYYGKCDTASNLKKLSLFHQQEGHVKKHWFCVVQQSSIRSTPEAVDCWDETEGPIGLQNCLQEISDPNSHSIDAYHGKCNPEQTQEIVASSSYLEL